MVAMEVRLHRERDGFAALAEPLYSADPVAHTVALTVLAQPMSFRALLTVHDAGAVVGAAFRNPARPLAVSGLPEPAAAGAAAALLEHDHGLHEVAGPRARAEAFAGAWCTATGGAARTLVDQRLFRLDALTPPAAVPGAARTAGLADVALLLRWHRAFVAEAVPHGPQPGEDDVRRKLTTARTQLWELPDGQPAAMAQASAPVRGMSRVGPVYTPPELRGHGYGSAVTAAASRWALDAGCRDVVLFTDLANPVSNAIYHRLGYRPVHDVVHLAVGSRAG